MLIPELHVQMPQAVLAVVIDLGAAAEQWGDLAWPSIEERLIRLVIHTQTERSRMVIRLGLNLEDAELILLFDYENLRVDFAQALFEAFHDLDPGPGIVASIPLQSGWYPLLAGVGGEPLFLVDSIHEPTLGRLRVQGNLLTWENLPFPVETLRDDPQGPVWPYLVRSSARSKGFVAKAHDLEIPLRIRALIEP